LRWVRAERGDVKLGRGMISIIPLTHPTVKSKDCISLNSVGSENIKKEGKGTIGHIQALLLGQLREGKQHEELGGLENHQHN